MMIIIIILSFPVSVLASPGDTNFHFRHCLNNCLYSTCDGTQYSVFRLNDGISFEWNCADNCRYDCMRQQEEQFRKKNMPVQKYFGHWPFIRVWGMEEPASVLFSVANGIPHFLYTLPYYFRHLSPESHYMRPWLSLFPYIGLLAWTSSALFHWKKNQWTVPLDYISALILLSYCLWLALRRTWGESALLRPRMVTSVASIFFVAVCIQCYRIAIGRVAFSDHLVICSVLAVVQSVVWVAWSTTQSSPLGIRCIVLQSWFMLAALLEVFDFPPLLGHFDAHSLWHAATVPLGFFWFNFWSLDSNSHSLSAHTSLSSTQKKKKKM